MFDIFINLYFLCDYSLDTFSSDNEFINKSVFELKEVLLSMGSYEPKDRDESCDKALQSFNEWSIDDNCVTTDANYQSIVDAMKQRETSIDSSKYSQKDFFSKYLSAKLGDKQQLVDDMQNIHLNS